MYIIQTYSNAIMIALEYVYIWHILLTTFDLKNLYMH